MSIHWSLFQPQCLLYLEEEEEEEEEMEAGGSRKNQKDTKKGERRRREGYGRERFIGRQRQKGASKDGGLREGEAWWSSVAACL